MRPGDRHTILVHLFPSISLSSKYIDQLDTTKVAIYHSRVRDATLTHREIAVINTPNVEIVGLNACALMTCCVRTLIKTSL